MEQPLISLFTATCQISVNTEWRKLFITPKISSQFSCTMRSQSLLPTWSGNNLENCKNYLFSPTDSKFNLLPSSLHFKLTLHVLPLSTAPFRFLSYTFRGLELTKIIKPTNSSESVHPKIKMQKYFLMAPYFFFQLLFAGSREEVFEVFLCEISSSLHKKICSCLTLLFRTLKFIPFCLISITVFDLYESNTNSLILFYQDVQNHSLTPHSGNASPVHPISHFFSCT